MCVIIIVSRGKGNKIKNKNKIKNLLTNKINRVIIIIEIKEREENKMTRKEMMDEVIKTRGMEDEKTIWFCELCEDSSLKDETLFLAFIAAVTCPIDTEE